MKVSARRRRRGSPRRAAAPACDTRRRPAAVVNTRRVGRFTRLHLLLAELDRAHGPQHQPNVEAPESCHQNCEEASQRLPEHEDEHIIKITIFVQRFHHGVKPA